ncbi:MAG: sodium:solute symporter family protein [Saprospiraceae bacterium]
MKLSLVDLSIVLFYFVLTLAFGFWISKRANANMRQYFLGGNAIPWYYLGLSNASGMFDISGTMWTVTILFVYGLKSAWIPWLWPVWNQVFVFVFLALWLRRSGVLTGAQWITFRFGEGRGARLSHIIVTVFAIISVFGFIAYFFEGIGKFAAIFFPWDLAWHLGPWQVSSAQSYALLLIGITTVYTIKGGMWSVVATEVLQLVIMTVSCIVVGVIAWNKVQPEMIHAVVPQGWGNLFFGWELNLNWSGALEAVNRKIESDGFELFGFLVMMMVFKGIFASLAGPVPSYDMQRVLSTKTPAEAAKMSALTILVLYAPRYLMVVGLCLLALGYLVPELSAMGEKADFETVLPLAIERFIPVGFKGLILAGLLAAFMGTFAAFINSAPAYLVNDLYKKYINPGADEKTLVRYSYWSSVVLVLIGLAFGFMADSLNSLTLWITSALYGGYTAANVLKWIWWRFNGYGYFLGMLAGLVGATVLPGLFPGVPAIYVFPLILALSFAGCIAGVLLSPAEEEETLKKFYRQTRPWGFWGPVIAKIKQEDPGFEENKDFGRDMFNVGVGIVWQMTQVILPFYLLMRDFQALAITFAVFLLCSWLLKRYWYDHMNQLQ